MKPDIQINRLLPLILSLCLVTSGCAVVLVGAGVGAGTFAYINGELKRDYEFDYDGTVKASSDALNSLKIPITEKTSDALKTIIKAKRPDGTPVTIKTVKLNQAVTEVSVRTGRVGFWDKDVSLQIHESIQHNMHRMHQAKSTRFPEPTAEEKTIPIVKTPELQNDAQPPNQTEASNASAVKKTAASTEPNKLQARLPEGFPFADRKVIIHFQHNSNEIPDEAYETLNRIANFMIGNSATKINIKGYTDSSGPSSYNTMVSELRANTIKNYLIAKGVAPGNMTTFGLGPQEFIASNETDEGRRLNRRVEIEFNLNN